jgi:hypothetical protein
MSLQHKKWEKTTSRRQYGIKNYFYSDSLTRSRNVKNKYVILRHLGDMCLFTSALRASVNKAHIPSLPQNNLYIFTKVRKVCGKFYFLNLDAFNFRVVYHLRNLRSNLLRRPASLWVLACEWVNACGGGYLRSRFRWNITLSDDISFG